MSMRNTQGFTLVELLLYVALTAILLLVMSAFLAMLLQARVKQRTIADIDQQGLMMVSRMTQTIRNSTGVTTPVSGGVSDELILTLEDVAVSPTRFYLDLETALVSEAGLAGVELHNSQTILQNLHFENLSEGGANDVIRVTFTLSRVNLEGRNEYDYARTFYATATRR